MFVRAALTFTLVGLLGSSLFAQGAPKGGADQRGGARPMPQQGKPQGQFGEGFRGGPRGPMGDFGGARPDAIGGAQPDAIGVAVLREHLTAAFDANENGQLDREECDLAIIAIRDRRQLAAQGVQPVLTEQDVVQIFDTDGNGQLNAAEFQGACRGMDAVLGEGASQRIAQQNGKGGGQGPQGGQFGQGGRGDGGRPKGFGGRGLGGRGGGSGGRGR